jgi:hypothetical protein
MRNPTTTQQSGANGMTIVQPVASGILMDGTKSIARAQLITVGIITEVFSLLS